MRLMVAFVVHRAQTWYRLFYDSKVIGRHRNREVGLLRNVIAGASSADVYPAICEAGGRS